MCYNVTLNFSMQKFDFLLPLEKKLRDFKAK